jgi:hypothetical protein
VVLTNIIGRRAVHSSRGTNTKAAKADTPAGTAVASPYTIQNLDAAIAHLEVAVAAECRVPVLGAQYWRRRVLQVASTRGIQHGQLRRLQRVLDGLGDEHMNAAFVATTKIAT